MRIARTCLIVGGGLLFLALGACSKSSPTQPTASGEYTLLVQWGHPGKGSGQFSGPRDVAVDGSGKVFVADQLNHRIQVFSPDTTFQYQWGDSGTANGQFNLPGHVAVDAAGNVFVADTYNHRIQKFTNAGVYLTQWGSEGAGNGQFEYPWGVAVDANGNVFVADSNNHRVEKFTGAGTYLTQWIAPANGGTEFPRGVAVDDSGNVYVVNSNNGGAAGNPRVQKFDNNGTYVTQWGGIGSGNGQFFNPDGIAVDPSGNVFVTDTENWRIQKFTRVGVYLTQWAFRLDGGSACAAGGVATDIAGNVYVAHWNFCCRVQKYGLRQ